MSKEILEAAERLIHEVNLYVAEHGNPMIVPNIQTDMFTVARAIQDLLAERGTYVLALEQIRSAPTTGTSWLGRYKDCVKTASKALDAHADQRISR